MVCKTTSVKHHLNLKYDETGCCFTCHGDLVLVTCFNTYFCLGLVEDVKEICFDLFLV